MAVAWHPDVNKKAYGMDSATIENVERVEFESGKARTFLKNTAAKKTHSFMLKMDDVGDNSEYKKFVTWWESTLLGGALSFYFPLFICLNCANIGAFFIKSLSMSLLTNCSSRFLSLILSASVISKTLS